MLRKCLFLVSLEITLKIIILKHHSGMVNYIKIMINRVHVIFCDRQSEKIQLV